jgi:RNA polymerase sigma-70 factor (ECF subfamily)
MIEALPRYRDRGLPFAAWIFRITRNAIIDQARTRRPQEPLDAAAARPAVIGDPLRAAEMASERQRLTAALEQLTPAQREVVTLRFFAGLSPAEVAAVIGKREEAVRGLQFRGLAALRQILGEASPAASHDLRRRPRLGAAER